MISESDLRELLDFSAPGPMLSVFLNTVPSAGNADAYKLRLRNLLKDVHLKQDVAAVERFFNLEHDWSGRSVAVFSCASKNFFRSYSFAIPISDQVFTHDRPAVKPLADVLDSFGGYGVILVDKQGARLFFFHLGELQEQEGVVGEVVKHTKRGGASAFPGRRGGTAGMTQHADEVVERNMKESADFAARFFEDKHVRRVLIGGTDENVKAFRSLLPKAWQSLVVGTFAMSMTASQGDVLAKAMQIGQEGRIHREKRLVETVVTAAAKGGTGVVGIEATLEAVHAGRIQTLIVGEGFHATGYRCSNCGYLTTKKVRACPMCGGSFEHVADAVELSVQAVLKGGGTVEVVHDSEIIKDAGKIGAMLRY
jgi:peptide chain release factor subunit 1